VTGWWSASTSVSSSWAVSGGRTYTPDVAFVRIAVVVVLIASGLVVFYGLILDRSGQNIAFTVAGLAVFGLTLAFIAAWFLGRALTDARWGRSGGALIGALAGGIFAVGAAMSLAAASIFAFIRV
jgi:hypothetical protein